MNAKGYVVRGTHRRGWPVFAYDHSGAFGGPSETDIPLHVFPSLDTASGARAHMVRCGCSDVAIFRVHADGREERLPSYEEAIGEIERLKDRSRMVRDVDEALHAAGIEERHGEKLGERAARAAMHRCEGPCCNKPAAGVTCSEECAANLSAWLNRGDPLAALEAAERRLLEAGGWTLAEPDVYGGERWWHVDKVLVPEARAVALTIERRRLAAKGGA